MADFPASDPRSPYAQWTAEQHRLSRDAGSHAQARSKLLEYLLDRYRDFEPAHRASAAGELAGLSVNERAVIVHHFLDGAGGGPDNVAAAEQRVTQLLSGWNRNDPAKQDRKFNAGVDDDSDEFSSPRSSSRVSAWLWDKIVRRLRRGKSCDSLITKALSQAPLLPATALQHLALRAADTARMDSSAAEMLVCSWANRGIYDSVSRAWRAWVLADRQGPVYEQLVSFFRDDNRRAKKRDRLRLDLADERRQVREAAGNLLVEIGDFSDVCLFQALHAAEPDPAEAAGIQRNIERLSRNIQAWTPS